MPGNQTGPVRSGLPSAAFVARVVGSNHFIQNRCFRKTAILADGGQTHCIPSGHPTFGRGMEARKCEVRLLALAPKRREVGFQRKVSPSEPSFFIHAQRRADKQPMRYALLERETSGTGPTQARYAPCPEPGLLAHSLKQRIVHAWQIVAEALMTAGWMASDLCGLTFSVPSSSKQ